MKPILKLFAFGLLFQLIPLSANCAPIELGGAGVRSAGTPMFFNLPTSPPGSVLVEFSVDQTPAHIEFFDHTNFALHVNDSNVFGNSILYGFIFTDQNQVPFQGADKDVVELGGFNSDLPTPPPNPLTDQIDPSQLGEKVLSRDSLRLARIDSVGEWLRRNSRVRC